MNHTTTNNTILTPKPKFTEPGPVNERSAAAAFNAQSPLFDDYYSGDTIIQYKRQRVRSHVERYLPAGSSILELNAGTGEDALYFAAKGHRVHATDISDGMLKRLGEKVETTGATGITLEQCSYTELDQLSRRGPYDLVFSNFAGLNCTDELEKVLRCCDQLVKPGGVLTLVVLPSFCAWETLLLFRGKWKTAFRRFSGKKGARSHIEGHYFRCWYYNPSFVEHVMRNSFEKIALEGLCTIVPPSYIEGFAEKHPWLYDFLCRWENRLKSRWPWKSIGDYYIITLRKKRH